MKTLPVSAVVPTVDRAEPLSKTLASLLEQGILPVELIVVDASAGDASREVAETFAGHVDGACKVAWLRAETKGAAAQRNQGVAKSTQDTIWFFDDDILFEPDCVARLWRAFCSSPEIGGVSAMITNQKYRRPGRLSRHILHLLGDNGQDYAGRVIGPGIGFLPEDRADLPETVPVDWLNLGCTLYKRDLLPSPPFSSKFTGYSIMEDLTLSLLVGKKARLMNARTARIFHDSQPGAHKSDICEMTAMETENRHYVMTQVLGKQDGDDYLKLLLWQAFNLLSSLRTLAGCRSIPAQICGRLTGWLRIMASRKSYE